MKAKQKCFSCEAKGINTPADVEVYIEVIGDIAPVCHGCLTDLVEESTLLDESDDDIEEDY